MKISLRKANAIQKSITDEITGLDFSTEVHINEFQNASDVLSDAQDRFFSNMEKRSNLNDALYEIRAAVSGANASSGINGLLTILAQNEKDISLYNKLSRLPEQIDVDVLNGKIDKIRNRKEDAYRGYGDDSVVTGIFNEATIKTFKNKLSSLKKSKQKLQDELLEMNVRTEIVLTDKTVNTLTEANIL